ncbi:Bifunctional protein HldE [Streptomyces glaucescens]
MTGPRRLVVVGDVLLDEDVEGVATRLAPDAPAPVVDVTDDRRHPGGQAWPPRWPPAAGGRSSW